jgi:hypothetical protein
MPSCEDPIRPVAFGLETRIGESRFRNSLFCPDRAYASAPAAFQPFQHGAMIWLDLGEAGRSIIVVKDAGRPAPEPSYMITEDRYREGEPLPPAAAPPPGLYVPVRGFYKIWYGSRGQGQWIGYGTAPERAERANVQFFGGGGLVVHLLETDQVWIFGPRYNYWEQW